MKRRCKRCGSADVAPNRKDVQTCRRCGLEQEQKCATCQGPAMRGDHSSCIRTMKPIDGPPGVELFLIEDAR